MSLRVLGFVLAALGGIALYACGGAYRLWPLQLVGLALVIGCLYVGWRWFAQQNKPPVIKPAANPAWSMREQPPPSKPGETLTHAPSSNDAGERRS
jgi:hypothetical protein